MAITVKTVHRPDPATTSYLRAALKGMALTFKHLVNPVSLDHAVLRDSLVPQMLESLGRNLFHQVPDAGLFEMGRVYCAGAKGKLGEQEHLCIGLMGKKGCRALERHAPVEDLEAFLWLKGLLESLCLARGVDGPELEPVEKKWMAKGRGASVKIGGTACGVMGLVSEELRKEWRMLEPVAVAELDMAVLIQPREVRELESIRDAGIPIKLVRMVRKDSRHTIESHPEDGKAWQTVSSLVEIEM